MLPEGFPYIESNSKLFWRNRATRPGDYEVIDAKEGRMQEEAREIVRKVIKEGLRGRGKEQSIFIDGLRCRYEDNGEQIRFDVPELEKSFVLMSGGV